MGIFHGFSFLAVFFYGKSGTYELRFKGFAPIGMMEYWNCGMMGSAFHTRYSNIPGDFQKQTVTEKRYNYKSL